MARGRKGSPIEIRMSGYYSVAEFAEVNEVPRAAVIQAIHDGAVKAERPGRRWLRIPYSEGLRIRKFGAPAS